MEWKWNGMEPHLWLQLSLDPCVTWLTLTNRSHVRAPCSGFRIANYNEILWRSPRASTPACRLFRHAPHHAWMIQTR
jgi:hypothetical protein